MLQAASILRGIFSSGLALALLAPLGGAHAASFQVLYSFSGGKTGVGPEASLLADGKGNLFGTTPYGGVQGCNQGGCGTIFKLGRHGQETVLYAFCSMQNCTDGATPIAGLIADQKGNLYGTTNRGGGTSCGTFGCGTVFEVRPHGSEKVLYPYGGPTYGNLLLGADGVFFGTTSNNGANHGGTIFSLRRDGKEKVLHSFCGSRTCADGNYPLSNLIADAQGNLYGTTDFGGVSGMGTIFKLAKDGTETVLYAFNGDSVGSHPIAGLIADQAGNLFGTTLYGGGSGCLSQGCGAVFKLAPDGTATSLHDFAGGNDGAEPYAGLVADGQENLYGTTTAGGGTGCTNTGLVGCGMVFEVAPDGTETVLHAFTGGTDGGVPYGGLILLNGYLYGTTSQGGTPNHCAPHGGCGVVFRVKK